MADQRYILDAVWAARLPKMWRWMRNLRVTGAASFKNTEDSCAISLPEAGGDAGDNAGPFVIPAKLTSRDGTDKTLYDWSQARRKTAGDWEVLSGGRTGTASDVPAIDILKRGDLTNQFVMMARGAYKDADPKAAPCWYIVADPTIVMIPVTVAVNAGSNGDDTTAATWTYDVTDLQGNAIAGGPFTPAWQREKGKKLSASNGTGYYDASGDFVLWEVDEVDDTGACPTS